MGVTPQRSIIIIILFKKKTEISSLITFLQMGEIVMNTRGPVGWGFYFVGQSLVLAQCDFSRGE